MYRGLSNVPLHLLQPDLVSVRPLQLRSTRTILRNPGYSDGIGGISAFKSENLMPF